MHHDVEREHSILQYVTIALDVYQVCRCVGHFVNKKSSGDEHSERELLYDDNIHV